MRGPTTLATLVVFAVAIACSGDSNAPDNSYVGSYALVSRNGEPLPQAIIDQPSLTVTLEATTLTLDAGDAYTNAVTLVTTIDGVAELPEQLSCTGTYSAHGDSFTLTSVKSSACGGGTLTGMRDGNTLTIGDSSQTLIYRR